MYSPFVSHRSFAPSILTAVCNGVILEWRGRRGGGEGCGKQREHSVGDLGRRRKGVWGVSSPAPAPPPPPFFLLLSSLVLRDRSTLINSTHLSQDDLYQSISFPQPSFLERLKLRRTEEPGLWPSLRWNSI